MFIEQMGISASFVTINVAVLVLISINHRVKVFTILATLNMVLIVFQPTIHNASGSKLPVETLIILSVASWALSFLIRAPKTKTNPWSSHNDE